MWRLLRQLQSEKALSQAKAFARIHLQQPGCRATDRRLAGDYAIRKQKMIFPIVPAWVKEGRDLASVGVKARQVGAFVEITFRAGKREISKVVRSMVLPGDDVLYV